MEKILVAPIVFLSLVAAASAQALSRSVIPDYRQSGIEDVVACAVQALLKVARDA
jgi:hypothetical protein